MLIGSSDYNWENNSYAKYQKYESYKNINADNNCDFKNSKDGEIPGDNNCCQNDNESIFCEIYTKKIIIGPSGIKGKSFYEDHEKNLNYVISYCKDNFKENKCLAIVIEKNYDDNTLIDVDNIDPEKQLQLVSIFYEDGCTDCNLKLMNNNNFHVLKMKNVPEKPKPKSKSKTQETDICNFKMNEDGNFPEGQTNCCELIEASEEAFCKIYPEKSLDFSYYKNLTITNSGEYAPISGQTINIKNILNACNKNYMDADGGRCHAIIIGKNYQDGTTIDTNNINREKELVTKDTAIITEEIRDCTDCSFSMIDNKDFHFISLKDYSLLCNMDDDSDDNNCCEVFGINKNILGENINCKFYPNTNISGSTETVSGNTLITTLKDCRSPSSGNKCNAISILKEDITATNPNIFTQDYLNDYKYAPVNVAFNVNTSKNDPVVFNKEADSKYVTIQLQQPTTTSTLPPIDCNFTLDDPNNCCSNDSGGSVTCSLIPEMAVTKNETIKILQEYTEEKALFEIYNEHNNFLAIEVLDSETKETLFDRKKFTNPIVYGKEDGFSKGYIDYESNTSKSIILKKGITQTPTCNLKEGDQNCCNVIEQINNCTILKNKKFKQEYIPGEKNTYNGQKLIDVLLNCTKSNVTCLAATITYVSKSPQEIDTESTDYEIQLLTNEFNPLMTCFSEEFIEDFSPKSLPTGDNQYMDIIQLSDTCTKCNLKVDENNNNLENNCCSILNLENEICKIFPGEEINDSDPDMENVQVKPISGTIEDILKDNPNALGFQFNSSFIEDLENINLKTSISGLIFTKVHENQDSKFTRKPNPLKNFVKTSPRTIPKVNCNLPTPSPTSNYNADEPNCCSTDSDNITCNLLTGQTVIENSSIDKITPNQTLKLAEIFSQYADTLAIEVLKSETTDGDFSNKTEFTSPIIYTKKDGIKTGYVDYKDLAEKSIILKKNVKRNPSDCNFEFLDNTNSSTNCCLKGDIPNRLDESQRSICFGHPGLSLSPGDDLNSASVSKSDKSIYDILLSKDEVYSDDKLIGIQIPISSNSNYDVYKKYDSIIVNYTKDPAEASYYNDEDAGDKTVISIQFKATTTPPPCNFTKGDQNCCTQADESITCNLALYKSVINNSTLDSTSYSVAKTLKKLFADHLDIIAIEVSNDEAKNANSETSFSSSIVYTKAAGFENNYVTTKTNTEKAVFINETANTTPPECNFSMTDENLDDDNCCKFNLDLKKLGKTLCKSNNAKSLAAGNNVANVKINDTSIYNLLKNGATDPKLPDGPSHKFIGSDIIGIEIATPSDDSKFNIYEIQEIKVNYKTGTPAYYEDTDKNAEGRTSIQFAPKVPPVTTRSPCKLPGPDQNYTNLEEDPNCCTQVQTTFTCNLHDNKTVIINDTITYQQDTGTLAKFVENYGEDDKILAIEVLKSDLEKGLNIDTQFTDAKIYIKDESYSPNFISLQTDSTNTKSVISRVNIPPPPATMECKFNNSQSDIQACCKTQGMCKINVGKKLVGSNNSMTPVEDTINGIITSTNIKYTGSNLLGIQFDSAQANTYNIYKKYKNFIVTYKTDDNQYYEDTEQDEGKNQVSIQFADKAPPSNPCNFTGDTAKNCCKFVDGDNFDATIYCNLETGKALKANHTTVIDTSMTGKHTLKSIFNNVNMTNIMAIQVKASEITESLTDETTFTDPIILKSKPNFGSNSYIATTINSATSIIKLPNFLEACNFTEGSPQNCCIEITADKSYKICQMYNDKIFSGTNFTSTDFTGKTLNQLLEDSAYNSTNLLAIKINQKLSPDALLNPYQGNLSGTVYLDNGTGTGTYNDQDETNDTSLIQFSIKVTPPPAAECELPAPAPGQDYRNFEEVPNCCTQAGQSFACNLISDKNVVSNNTITKQSSPVTGTLKEIFNNSNIVAVVISAEDAKKELNEDTSFTNAEVWIKNADYTKAFVGYTDHTTSIILKSGIPEPPTPMECKFDVTDKETCCPNNTMCIANVNKILVAGTNVAEAPFANKSIHDIITSEGEVYSGDKLIGIEITEESTDTYEIYKNYSSLKVTYKTGQPAYYEDADSDGALNKVSIQFAEKARDCNLTPNDAQNCCSKKFIDGENFDETISCQLVTGQELKKNSTTIIDTSLKGTHTLKEIFNNTNITNIIAVQVTATEAQGTLTEATEFTDPIILKNNPSVTKGYFEMTANADFSIIKLSDAPTPPTCNFTQSSTANCCTNTQIPFKTKNYNICSIHPRKSFNGTNSTKIPFSDKSINDVLNDEQFDTDNLVAIELENKIIETGTTINPFEIQTTINAYKNDDTSKESYYNDTASDLNTCIQFADKAPAGCVLPTPTPGQNYRNLEAVPNCCTQADESLTCNLISDKNVAPNNTITKQKTPVTGTLKEIFNNSDIVAVVISADDAKKELNEDTSFTNAEVWIKNANYTTAFVGYTGDTTSIILKSGIPKPPTPMECNFDNSDSDIAACCQAQGMCKANVGKLLVAGTNVVKAPLANKSIHDIITADGEVYSGNKLIGIEITEESTETYDIYKNYSSLNVTYKTGDPAYYEDTDQAEGENKVSIQFAIKDPEKAKCVLDDSSPEDPNCCNLENDPDQEARCIITANQILVENITTELLTLANDSAQKYKLNAIVSGSYSNNKIPIGIQVLNSEAVDLEVGTEFTEVKLLIKKEGADTAYYQTATDKTKTHSTIKVDSPPDPPTCNLDMTGSSLAEGNCCESILTPTRSICKINENKIIVNNEGDNITEKDVTDSLVNIYKNKTYGGDKLIGIQFDKTENPEFNSEEIDVFYPYAYKVYYKTDGAEPAYYLDEAVDANQNKIAYQFANVKTCNLELNNDENCCNSIDGILYCKLDVQSSITNSEDDISTDLIAYNNKSLNEILEIRPDALGMDFTRIDGQDIKKIDPNRKLSNIRLLVNKTAPEGEYIGPGILKTSSVPDLRKSTIQFLKTDHKIPDNCTHDGNPESDTNCCGDTGFTCSDPGGALHLKVTLPEAIPGKRYNVTYQNVTLKQVLDMCSSIKENDIKCAYMISDFFNQSSTIDPNENISEIEIEFATDDTAQIGRAYVTPEPGAAFGMTIGNQCSLKNDPQPNNCCFGDRILDENGNTINNCELKLGTKIKTTVQKQNGDIIDVMANCKEEANKDGKNKNRCNGISILSEDLQNNKINIDQKYDYLISRQSDTDDGVNKFNSVTTGDYRDYVSIDLTDKTFDQAQTCNFTMDTESTPNDQNCCEIIKNEYQRNIEPTYCSIKEDTNSTGKRLLAVGGLTVLSDPVNNKTLYDIFNGEDFSDILGLQWDNTDESKNNFNTNNIPINTPIFGLQILKKIKDKNGGTYKDQPGTDAKQYCIQLNDKKVQCDFEMTGDDLNEENCCKVLEPSTQFSYCLLRDNKQLVDTPATYIQNVESKSISDILTNVLYGDVLGIQIQKNSADEIEEIDPNKIILDMKILRPQSTKTGYYKDEDVTEERTFSYCIKLNNVQQPTCNFENTGTENDPENCCTILSNDIPVEYLFCKIQKPGEGNNSVELKENETTELKSLEEETSIYEILTDAKYKGDKKILGLEFPYKDKDDKFILNRDNTINYYAKSNKFKILIKNPSIKIKIGYYDQETKAGSIKDENSKFCIKFTENDYGSTICGFAKEKSNLDIENPNCCESLDDSLFKVTCKLKENKQFKINETTEKAGPLNGISIFDILTDESYQNKLLGIQIPNNAVNDDGEPINFENIYPYTKYSKINVLLKLDNNSVSYYQDTDSAAGPEQTTCIQIAEKDFSTCTLVGNKTPNECSTMFNRNNVLTNCKINNGKSLKVNAMTEIVRYPDPEKNLGKLSLYDIFNDPDLNKIQGIEILTNESGDGNIDPFFKFTTCSILKSKDVNGDFYEDEDFGNRSTIQFKNKPVCSIPIKDSMKFNEGNTNCCVYDYINLKDCETLENKQLIKSENTELDKESYTSYYQALNDENVLGFQIAEGDNFNNLNIFEVKATPIMVLKIVDPEQSDKAFFTYLNSIGTYIVKIRGKFKPTTTVPPQSHVKVNFAEKYPTIYTHGELSISNVPDKQKKDVFEFPNISIRQAFDTSLPNGIVGVIKTLEWEDIEPKPDNLGEEDICQDNLQDEEYDVDCLRAKIYLSSKVCNDPDGIADPNKLTCGKKSGANLMTFEEGQPVNPLPTSPPQTTTPMPSSKSNLTMILIIMGIVGLLIFGFMIYYFYF